MPLDLLYKAKLLCSGFKLLCRKLGIIGLHDGGDHTYTGHRDALKNIDIVLIKSADSVDGDGYSIADIP